MFMRMTKDQVEQLNSDLKRSPGEFGYPQVVWTAQCLCRHLNSRYGVRYALRHCRRIIASTRTNVTQANTQLTAMEGLIPPAVAPSVWAGFSDESRHSKILQRLRRLSSAGLPLKPYAEILFEQLAAATNSREAMQMIGLGRPEDLKLIFRDQETMDWTATNLKSLDLVNSDDSKLSGMKVPYSQLRFIDEPVLATPKLIESHFHDSPAYNEVWKYHKVHIGVMTFFRDNGRYVGLGPIWKSKRERPFTQADLQFLARAVPLITHGLVTAQALTSPIVATTETEPVDRPVGIVTADLQGKVLAMDRTARCLFGQPAVLDGRSADAFGSSNLREGLRYVTGVIREAFTGRFSSDERLLAVPAARVWWHATGTVLLLKAVLSERASRSPLVTILVEERELVSMKQRRLALRHGMSDRESQVLQLVRAGASRKKIAEQLGLSVNTVRTYIKQIGLKGVVLGNQPSQTDLGSIGTEEN